MKAAILEAFGSPLQVKDLPDPEIGTGEVVDDTFVAGVVKCSNEVFSGVRRYLIEPPIVPVANGRNAAVHRRVAAQYGPRVRSVVMSGSEEADRAVILEAAGGPLDCMIDFLPPEASPVQVHKAMFCIRPHGRISLMGGVGMLGDGNLSLPYRWIMRNDITIGGQWMYNRDAVSRMMGLVRGGLIDLGFGGITAFPLDDVNAAVDHAAQNAGAFSRTVLRLMPR